MNMPFRFAALATLGLLCCQNGFAQTVDVDGSKLASMYCAASAIRPSSNDPRGVYLQDQQASAYERHEANLANADHPWKDWQLAEIQSLGGAKGNAMVREHIINKREMSELESRCLTAVTTDPVWQADFPAPGTPARGYAATKWQKVFQDTGMAVLVDSDPSHITQKDGVRYVTVGFLYSEYRFVKATDGSTTGYSSAVTRVGYRCADRTAAGYQTAYFKQTLWHEQFGLSGENLNRKLEPASNEFTERLLDMLCS